MKPNPFKKFFDTYLSGFDLKAMGVILLISLFIYAIYLFTPHDPVFLPADNSVPVPIELKDGR